MRFRGRDIFFSSARLSSVSAVTSSSDLARTIFSHAYSKNRHRSTIPLSLSKLPVNQPYAVKANIETKKNRHRHASEVNSTFFTGRISWAKPAIKAVLHIIEPKAFPALIAAEPSKAAVVDTRISGRVVPMLTIVAPTTIWGIPIFLASATDASTSLSPPKQINTSPATNNKITETIYQSSKSPFLSHSDEQFSVYLSSVRSVKRISIASLPNHG